MRALSLSHLVAVTGVALGCAATPTATDLVKPALRRALLLLAPASHADVIRFVADPLAPLGVVREVVEAALEELIVYGDALEMRKLRSDPWDAPPLVLRPAPPSFVTRDDHKVVIIGVAGDQPSALSPELEAQVAEAGPVRILHDPGNDALSAHLLLLGFAALSEQAWLRTPKAVQAAAHVQSSIEPLSHVAETPGGIDDLEILDPDRSVRYYTGRWRAPDPRTTGTFLARRPQLYGARLWSIAAFDQGVCGRLLDLYEDEERHRPCDIAWRFQAAVDAAAGHAQEVRVRKVGKARLLDFFSPLPAFAERRLALAGMKRPSDGCLFSFEMDETHVEAELAALQTNLWMRPVREEETR